MADASQILRPIPRRAFEITPASTDTSIPPSPPADQVNPELSLDRKPDTFSSASRTRSILNLTSSTLLGIYSPTGNDGSREEASTPWGTGAQTPSHRTSMDDSRSQISNLSWDAQTPRPQGSRRRTRVGVVPSIFRFILLFSFGVAYGTIITHLQKSQNIAAVRVPGFNGSSWYPHIAWGLSGVLLGNALPWVDMMWDEENDASTEQEAGPIRHRSSRSGSQGFANGSPPSFDEKLGADWYSAVRSIGAFVGIAFAVRKLPWQSTLQVSITLALANPVLWYLIDRSKPGFAFSAAVGLLGTIVLSVVNPELVPLPALVQQPAASSESLGVFIWMASILFCTSLCFGAVGRKISS